MLALLETGRALGVGVAFGLAVKSAAESAVLRGFFSLIKFDTRIKPPKVSSTNTIRIEIACLFISLLSLRRSVRNLNFLAKAVPSD